MEAAVVRGDVAYVERVSAPDLLFTHGDGWTTGGKALGVDDRASFLKRVERTVQGARSRFCQRRVTRRHRYYVWALRGTNRSGNPDQSWFSVWFERVYAKREGRWLFGSSSKSCMVRLMDRTGQSVSDEKSERRVGGDAKRAPLYRWPNGWISIGNSATIFSRLRSVRDQLLYGIYGWVAAGGMEQIVRGDEPNTRLERIADTWRQAEQAEPS